MFSCIGNRGDDGSNALYNVLYLCLYTLQTTHIDTLIPVMFRNVFLKVDADGLHKYIVSHRITDNDFLIALANMTWPVYTEQIQMVVLLEN